jgi:Ca2+-transporting ATPase
MQIVLLVAGLLSLYPLRQLGTGLLLIALTLANAVLGLQQEGEAESAVAALQRRLIVTARVRRDGHEAEIPAEQLVPGDVVSIEAGDVVPADGRLLRAATLEVAESELTGESLPVSRGKVPVGEADMPQGDRTDMVYMNTSVTRGTGEFVVTATGMATEVGHISGMLQAQPTVKTPLTRQLDRLSKQLLLVAGVALIASLAVNLSRGYTFNAVLPAAVAFAIAAVPVQLPMVVTTILAWGTRALVKVGAIMKQLPSTETLGSIRSNRHDAMPIRVVERSSCATSSRLRSSLARARYAVAPLDSGEYAEIGLPWLGASESRTLRGMTVVNTRAPRCRRTSAATSDDNFVRASNMVSTTPLTPSAGFW